MVTQTYIHPKYKIRIYAISHFLTTESLFFKTVSKKNWSSIPIKTEKTEQYLWINVCYIIVYNSELFTVSKCLNKKIVSWYIHLMEYHAFIKMKLMTR